MPECYKQKAACDLLETLMLSLLFDGARSKRELFAAARARGYRHDSKGSEATLMIYFGTLLTSVKSPRLS